MTDTNNRTASEIHRGEMIRGPGGVHPGSYACSIEGDCLAPVLRHGEMVLIEPIWPIEGEFAVIYPKGSPCGSIKRMLMAVQGIPCSPKSEVIPLVLFEQLNPPKQYQARGDRIERVDRVSMVLRDGKWIPLREAQS